MKASSNEIHFEICMWTISHIKYINICVQEKCKFLHYPLSRICKYSYVAAISKFSISLKQKEFIIIIVFLFAGLIQCKFILLYI